ncbi:hypothetical protein [Pseudomonas sp. KNUC1026]|uniref:hypothetical protein n=1 Tax=Pseudomonas sp. KNUC1026 TaxID=2893890 RepID=UPI001F39A528|nr:hypothetical protein [Pseudomonas sp. KNUC1026]UFH51565.1 hypothetical protein LN139_11760 [Pseudomonas sp. KNUC1026]
MTLALPFDRYARAALICLAMGLSACSVHKPMEQPAPPVPSIPPNPGSLPSTPATPGAPATPATSAPAKPAPRTSASFAPPPSGPSHWDASLGVYVLEGTEGLYYRQRTYYRFDNGWAWATSPNGPWQDTDSSGVPPGLGRMHP